MFTDLQAATKRKAKGKTISMISCCLQKSEVKNYNEMHCTWVDATSTFLPPLACFPALCALGRVACTFSRAFNQLFFFCAWHRMAYCNFSRSFNQLLFFRLGTMPYLRIKKSTNQYQISQMFSKWPKTVYKSFFFCQCYTLGTKTYIQMLNLSWQRTYLLVSSMILLWAFGGQ